MTWTGEKNKDLDDCLRQLNREDGFEEVSVLVRPPPLPRILFSYIVYVLLLVHYSKKNNEQLILLSLQLRIYTEE